MAKSISQQPNVRKSRSQDGAEALKRLQDETAAELDALLPASLGGVNK
jgi:hypothetical protein